MTDGTLCNGYQNKCNCCCDENIIIMKPCEEFATHNISIDLCPCCTTPTCCNSNIFGTIMGKKNFCPDKIIKCYRLDPNFECNDLCYPVRNIEVQLFNVNNLNNVIDIAFTDNFGRFIFTNIACGCYLIKVLFLNPICNVINFAYSPELSICCNTNYCKCFEIIRVKK